MIKDSQKLKQEYGENTALRDTVSEGLAESRAKQETYPLSQAQKGILVESLSHPDTTVYNIPHLFRLSVRLDLMRLKEAVETAVAAHPYLNATIVTNPDGEFMIKRDDEAVLTVEYTETAQLPKDLVTPFDILKEKLCRLRIYKTDDGNYLFMDFHHIVSDGTSISILMSDIAAAYNGGDVVPETYTGFDAALDEEKLRGTDRYDKAAAYFRDLLADAEPDMLPEGDVCEKTPSSGCFNIRSAIGASEISAFCRKNGVRKTAFYNAVFSFVMCKYNCKDNVLYATLYNGRNDPRLDRTVSMMVQTLPVFCHLSTEQTVSEFAHDIGRQIEESKENYLYSFSEIVHEHHITPDILFNYQDKNLLFDSVAGEPAEHTILPGNEAKAPLHVEIYEKNGEILFSGDYRSNIYSADYINRLISCMEQAMREFLRDPKLKDVCLADARTCAEMDAFNATEADLPETDIVSLFRETVRKYPDREAVIFRDEVFSYRQADEISERIAGYLRANGVGRGDVVSILIPRCSYMVTASLGVLKSGAAYQPLDPSYPTERLTFMMQDSGAKLLIADESLLSKVPEYKGKVLLTNDIPALPECEKMTETVSPSDLFILLYTSGSTGTPKGVMLEHRNLANFVEWYRGYYDLDENARVASYASYGFDVNMMDLYPALTTGACVCIIEEEIRLDLVAMEKWFNRLGITHAIMTTQVGRQFYSMTNTEKLRYLSAAGEKLVPIPPRSGDPAFYNGYGPTECTILATCKLVDRLYERVPIGKPLTNYKCYVVDKNLNRLPPFIPGELLIAGRGVARGYLNRPDLTEKAFIKNPFCDKPGFERAYRTGDIVRLLPNGEIDFIGRNDGQVKVRGFRIELTEVECVIREFPGIKDATVHAFEDENTGEKFIAAYVVSDSEVDIPALDDFIRERKPSYMVPAVTMQIDRIPLNQNSKVNKRALPRPEPKPRTSAEKVCADIPLNLLEQELKKLVSDIIGTTDFGITDRFADLGLSSISSIRLAMQIYKRFNIQLDARRLMTEGFIQSIENDILAGFLDKDHGNAVAPAPETASGKKASAQSCRLTFAQQGVYTECQAEPDSVRYNLPMALRFPEGTDAGKLEEAVRKVIDAHPYILCRFVPGEGNEIVQEPIPGFKLEIPVTELSPDEYEAHKKAFVRPFDLAKGPAVRFEIVKTDCLVLLGDMHHLVSDGASVDLFISQLCNALDGEEPEKESYSYYDFASEESIAPETEEFFAGQMTNAEEATRLIPDIFDDKLIHAEREVSVGTDIAAVKGFARNIGVTPAAVYLAGCYVAFGRYVCEDTVAIATISNGRRNLKVGNTLGMFVNTLPLVMPIDKKEATADFVRRAAEGFTETIANENYPFARIASKYDFHPSISYAYQIGVINEYRTKLGQVETELIGQDIAKIPVSVFINGTEDDAQISVAYDSALYSEEMMRGLAESIGNAVLGLMTCRAMSEISLTGEAQWKVLDGYNRPWDLGYDKTDTVVTKFRKVVQAQPDKTAAVFKDKAYTYRELDELTDRLAAKLRHHVCAVTGKECLKEEVVSILVPRNENVFILPLAAVKAGLAYEPLDPGYPKERLNFMVKDAGACLLLAEDSLRDLVDEYEGPVLTVSELYAMEDEEPADLEQSPEDLFILLYTSGSTGTPKGCQIEHSNVVSYAYGVRNDFYTQNDRIAAYASFGFDVNMSDVFCTLLNGGTVYLIPEEIRMDLGALAGYFDEVGITALLLTTQVGVQFLTNYPSMKTLRMLVMGGEKLPAVDPSRLSYTIVNGYGPTENCCGVSLFPIKAWEPNIPIGKPMSTIHAYVLDKTGHRLPAGAAGEYCLSGPQVSRGYLNRPDKTAEVYEPCPFNEFRMYHTGDIVRYRRNGDVEFVGRKDGQVKIRGFRIETKEVESVIRGFPGVRDVTVQAYDYESGGKYLAAFVVCDTELDTAQLTEYIKTQKPAYMVPAAIMQIEKIPLTVNQKVDKKALPEPKLQKSAYVAPSGKTEEDLCAVFGSVLGIERMSAEDDFFDVGGSSILAMKVVIAAEKAGYSIVYNDVFGYPTPRAMAAFIDEREGNTAKPAGIPSETDAQTAPEIGRDGYDYSKIHELLSRNTVKAFRSGKQNPLNDVLLLGATGYLGSHVLHELITDHDSRIFCFVRPGKDQSGQERLLSLLRYYFNDDYSGLFGTRISVIEGDATEPGSLMSFAAPSADMTVINCAASVKHFARGDEIERANVNSVRSLTAWCEKNNARLVHISTGSVAGDLENGVSPMSFRFDEHTLYSGQIIDNNQYVHSKFMAERHVYEEILGHGLRAKVLRMGNLAPRAKDGEFQINYKTNSYMNNFRAFQALGMVSFDELDLNVEFSPIDSIAKAVIALAGTPDDCICFIPLNPHRPLISDVVRALNEEGYPVRGAEPEEFAGALHEALSDEKKREAVSSLAAYDSGDNTRPVGPESCDNSLTMQILERLGFSWPETGVAYIRQFVAKLKQKGYFGGDRS
ncbi:MAG: amino acid adenylation domain-containing protein [Ruminiclostridium sp.]|nr:amino acid adenylation domain-containing protein [Ruminiclostridium sp.]